MIASNIFRFAPCQGPCCDGCVLFEDAFTREGDGKHDLGDEWDVLAGEWKIPSASAGYVKATGTSSLAIARKTLPNDRYAISVVMDSLPYGITALVVIAYTTDRHYLYAATKIWNEEPYLYIGECVGGIHRDLSPLSAIVSRKLSEGEVLYMLACIVEKPGSTYIVAQASVVNYGNFAYKVVSAFTLNSYDHRAGVGTLSGTGAKFVNFKAQKSTAQKTNDENETEECLNCPTACLECSACEDGYADVVLGVSITGARDQEKTHCDNLAFTRYLSCHGSCAWGCSISSSPFWNANWAWLGENFIGRGYFFLAAHVIQAENGNYKLRMEIQSREGLIAVWEKEFTSRPDCTAFDDDLALVFLTSVDSDGRKMIDGKTCDFSLSTAHVTSVPIPRSTCRRWQSLCDPNLLPEGGGPQELLLETSGFRGDCSWMNGSRVLGRAEAMAELDPGHFLVGDWTLIDDSDGNAWILTEAPQSLFGGETEDKILSLTARKSGSYGNLGWLKVAYWSFTYWGDCMAWSELPGIKYDLDCVGLLRFKLTTLS